MQNEYHTIDRLQFFIPRKRTESAEQLEGGMSRGVNVDKRTGRFKPKVSLKSRLTLCKSFLSVFVVNFLTCVTRNERKGERGRERIEKEGYVVS